MHNKYKRIVETIINITTKVQEAFNDCCKVISDYNKKIYSDKALKKATLDPNEENINKYIDTKKEEIK